MGGLVAGPVWLWFLLSGDRRAREAVPAGLGSRVGLAVRGVIGVGWGLLWASLATVAWRPWGALALAPFGLAVVAGLGLRAVRAFGRGGLNQADSEWEARSSARDLPLEQISAAVTVRGGRFPSIHRTRQERARRSRI